MLLKYFGEITTDNIKNPLPRVSFLTDGLFRFTQPVFLNDKGSEGKFFPYFNEFSPADIEWARKKDASISRTGSKELSENELINFYLRPTGVRVGEIAPHLVKIQSGHQSIDEYDRDTFENTVYAFNKTITDLLSQNIGIFSLCKSENNEHMWTHYASEGRGIAISFNEEHAFFKINKPQDVSYKPEDRATITYYKGAFRVNGYPSRSFINISTKSDAELFMSVLSNGIDIEDLTRRLLFSKANHWSLENEARILLPLSTCEYKCGREITSKAASKLQDCAPGIFLTSSEINLKKIPFSAFDTLYFGSETSPENIEKILIIIKGNSELSHMKVKKMRFDIYGHLQAHDIL